ncbi:MAG: hypothetical protein HOH77_05665 [Candidatus Latescibacteria bacterium]|jgi:hypothetical protein|nr:hypothetical protein [Candidatus Latescibacterota bacterium]
MFSEEHRKLYERDGFFVVDDAVDPDMFVPLLKATVRTKKRVRAGEVDQFTHRAPDGDRCTIVGGRCNLGRFICHRLASLRSQVSNTVKSKVCS